MPRTFQVLAMTLMDARGDNGAGMGLLPTFSRFWEATGSTVGAGLIPAQQFSFPKILSLWWILQGQLYFSSYTLPRGVASAAFLNLVVTERREK